MNYSNSHIIFTIEFVLNTISWEIIEHIFWIKQFQQSCRKCKFEYIILFIVSFVLSQLFSCLIKICGSNIILELTSTCHFHDTEGLFCLSLISADNYWNDPQEWSILIFFLNFEITNSLDRYLFFFFNFM